MRPRCENCRRFRRIDGASVCEIGSRRYWMTMQPDVCGQYKAKERSETNANPEKDTKRQVGST